MALKGESIHSMGTVPAFLVKLVNLLENTDNNDIITWNHDGRSFHIYDQSRLAKELLPLYFKHNNIASFIRQLNMYGFRKLVDNTGNYKVEHEDFAFAHPYFIRGRDDLLENIKRKVPVSKKQTVLKPSNTILAEDSEQFSREDVHNVLSEVTEIKNKQLHMDSKIGSLKRENEALWREVATLRQKHHRQQVVVNKLIQFLVRAVGSRGMPTGSKRKLMMLEGSNATPGNGPSRGIKIPRQYYDVESPKTPYNNSEMLGSTSKGGVTIQEVQSPESSNKDSNVVENFNFEDDPEKYISFDNPNDVHSLDSSLSKSDAEELLEDPVVMANVRKALAENLGQSVSSFNQADNLINLNDSSTIYNPLNNIGTTDTLDPMITKHTGVSKGKTKKPKTGKLKLNIPNTACNTLANPSPTRIGEETLDQLALSVPKTYQGQFTPEIMDNHLDSVQLDLNSIKDILSDGYTLDNDTLHKIFSAEQIQNPLSVSTTRDSIFNSNELLPTNDEYLKSLEDQKESELDADKTMGNELIQFSHPPDDLSALFDLGDVPLIENDDLADNNGDLNTPLVTPLSGDMLNRTTSFTNKPSSSRIKMEMEEVD